jgi:hypothetical protein
MSFNVLIAICVLACDFMIYAFFQWTFGGKRREFRRRRPLPKRPGKSPTQTAAATPYVISRQQQRDPRRHRHTEREVA